MSFSPFNCYWSCDCSILITISSFSAKPHWLVGLTEMSLASQNMYRAVKEAYEPEWVGYTELTAAVEVSPFNWSLMV